MSQIIDIIRCVVQQELARTRTSLLGVVTAIFAHEAKDDSNNYEASVRFKHEDWELARIPIAIDHTGAASLPAVGDLVLVQFIDGDLNQPVITGRFYHEDNRPPLHKAGEVMFEQRYGDKNNPKLNQLRFGADGAIYLQQNVLNPTDNSAALATIKIDADGSLHIQQDTKQGEDSSKIKAAIVIDKDGNITLNADEKVVVKLTNNSNLEIKCQTLKVTGDAEITGKTTLDGDTTIKTKLTVGIGPTTMIEGGTITGG